LLLIEENSSLIATLLSGQDLDDETAVAEELLKAKVPHLRKPFTAQQRPKN
jgi:hypothetical protein